MCTGECARQEERQPAQETSTELGARELLHHQRGGPFAPAQEPFNCRSNPAVKGGDVHGMSILVTLIIACSGTQLRYLGPDTVHCPASVCKESLCGAQSWLLLPTP